MNIRKAIAAAVSLCLAAGTVCLPLTVSAADPACREIDPLQYTYEIYPLLAPFNEYFFVRTDNPHPESFRFSDKDSPYSETSVIYNEDKLYADVEYENPEMYRVNGGYLFKSFTTNGGEVTLQIQQDITRAEFNTEIYGTPDPETTGYSPYHGMPVGSYDQHYENSWAYSIVGYYKWVDSDLTFTLPPLVDDCDYLIQTYGTEADFFSNMSAVQSGFSSVCLYSGSYIRGEVYRSGDRDWHLTPGFHVDQSFYIYSPFDRRDNQSLFASAIYPYRYDSLGFPGMMGQVSKRLSDESTYEWSSTSHANINVTYQGETKTYGGQGNGEGQGLTADKLTHTFTFGDRDESLTLQDARALLDAYAAVEMEDDIPREDELTWAKIYDVVGDGAWVDMGGYYTYLYQKDDRASFSSDEWGVGNQIYWGGSLGYCRDTWVDGRYINKTFVKGATLEEHPESAVMLTQVTVPEITDYERKWDSASGSYVYSSAQLGETVQKNVLYRYDAEAQVWKANVTWGGYDYNFATFQTLADQGVIAQNDLDPLILTREEVEALIAAGNSAADPDSGFIFDGYSPQGTPFLKGDCNSDSKCSVLDVILLQKWLLAVPDTSLDNWRNVDLTGDRKLDVFDLGLLKSRLLSQKS